jgi:biotin-dependent carboxylase-like uncharacterized protein
MIEVVRPGPLATVQDAGRPGYGALGVPRSGAFDRRAAALANRLVGNRADAALLEITLGGLTVRLHRAATLALTGAACPGEFDWGTPVSLPAGAVVRLGTPATGMRSYLSVRGGIDVPVFLGSRSCDRRSGLGPEPLAAGDRLPIGSGTGQSSDAVSASPAVPDPPVAALDVLPGPRRDWFVADALEVLTTAPWLVRPESDRVGVRLAGPELRRARGGELPSEAARPGAIQVPAAGRPVLFGPDCPTIGGYPVLAVLTEAARDAAGQLRPGDTIGFRLVRGRPLGAR